MATGFDGRLGLVLLGLVACKASASGNDEARKRAQEWNREVAASKAQDAVLVRPGAAPRQVLAPPLGVGQELDADIDVASTTRIEGSAGEMKRSHSLHARLRLRGLPPTEDEGPRISLEITELSGDLRDLDKLPRTGVIEPGAHGEPWMAFLTPGAGDAGGPTPETVMVWERDVKGWARRVLMPVPPDPLGVGATWRREWKDYMGGEKITERHEYVLTAVDKRFATIKARTSSEAWTSAGGSQGTSTARITLPLGRRAVPTSEWTDHGAGRLTEPNKTTVLDTSTRMRIRPHLAR